MGPDGALWGLPVRCGNAEGSLRLYGHGYGHGHGLNTSCTIAPGGRMLTAQPKAWTGIGCLDWYCHGTAYPRIEGPHRAPCPPPRGRVSDCPLRPWGRPQGHPGAQGIENGSTKSAVNLCQPAANLFVHGVSHKSADFGPILAPLLPIRAQNQFLAISLKTAPKTSGTPLERCGMKS